MGEYVEVCSGQIMVVFKFIGIILDIIKIAVPIILIIMGSIDFAKAIVAGKDDEIKKSQSTFIKRVIAAVIVFFVPTIVGLLLSLINQDKNACLSCVLNTSTCNITETSQNSYKSTEKQDGLYNFKECDIEDEKCISEVIYDETR